MILVLLLMMLLLTMRSLLRILVSLLKILSQAKNSCLLVLVLKKNDAANKGKEIAIGNNVTVIVEDEILDRSVFTDVNNVPMHCVLSNVNPLLGFIDEHIGANQTEQGLLINEVQGAVFS